MKNNRKYAYKIISLFNTFSWFPFINVFYGFKNYNCFLFPLTTTMKMLSPL